MCYIYGPILCIYCIGSTTWLLQQSAVACYREGRHYELQEFLHDFFWWSLLNHFRSVWQCDTVFLPILCQGGKRFVTKIYVIQQMYSLFPCLPSWLDGWFSIRKKNWFAYWSQSLPMELLQLQTRPIGYEKCMLSYDKISDSFNVWTGHAFNIQYYNIYHTYVLPQPEKCISQSTEQTCHLSHVQIIIIILLHVIFPNYHSGNMISEYSIYSAKHTFSVTGLDICFLNRNCGENIRYSIYNWQSARRTN